ncbi:MAG: FAD-binding and (Fe-S)-binding domain-containing protein [Chthoniobacterales bacterium]
MISAQRRTLAAAHCDVAFDNRTRQLYATDASLYQIEPAAVAFPRTAREARDVILAGANAGLSISPRGAGTGLAGGALGEGLIVDFARHNRQITNLDLERRTVRVSAGVILDQLNDFLEPHGFCFGPDVATSSRATLGGMIANNSSGAHVPVYGTTADHVRALQIVLADGRIAKVGQGQPGLEAERAKIAQFVRQEAAEIAARMPPGMLKRWNGYALERFSRAPDDLTEILAGSEGTLAAIFSAELQIVPLPRRKALGLVFFTSVAEAMQATVELLDLKPAAIEHIDRTVFDQTKGQLSFVAARNFLELDSRPCESILVVEFYDDDVTARLAALSSRKLGLRTLTCTDDVQMNLVWSMRKSGLSLLTGRPGSAKPVACIEDAAVRPAQLPAYVAGLQSIMKPLGLEVSYYGHAASGLLHVRPVLDLHKASDLKKYRQVADEVSALVRQFKGSLAAEHGVGIARTEYLREQVGPQLFEIMRAIKRTFDPKNLLNPGKLIGDDRFKIDADLRDNFTRPIELPFEPVLAFAAKDHSFVGNLEQCNGCGGCRKDAPTMCPTFLATGEEYMSTRGRANAIRAALELRIEGDDPLRAQELEDALSNCLACKACTTECPSNVNLALLKAELIHARYERDGLPWRVRLLCNIDSLGRIGCLLPSLANAALDFAPLRALLEKTLGISARRSLPHYPPERFDHWFFRHERPPKRKTRGKIILWDDTFVRYHEPQIGVAAVAVLEALGFEVTLPTKRKCCGRPAFSQGNLKEAARLGRHNLDLFHRMADSLPILFLEPSCYSMFVEDYRELNLPQAQAIAARCFLFEKFVADLLESEPKALQFTHRAAHVAIHAHCHAKSLLHPGFMVRLAERLPGREATLLETGCCGMAGAFGMLEAKYELSLQVAAPLIEKVTHQPPESVVVASGTSCRHQISDLTPAHPQHMAELLAEALA